MTAVISAISGRWSAMNVPMWAWAAFAAVIVVMLLIDLLAHRGAHVIGFKEAAWWSALWVGLSLVFAVVVTLTLGVNSGVEFTTAWLLEKSLSVEQPLRVRPDLRLLQGAP